MSAFWFFWHTFLSERCRLQLQVPASLAGGAFIISRSCHYETTIIASKVPVHLCYIYAFCFIAQPMLSTTTKLNSIKLNIGVWYPCLHLCVHVMCMCFYANILGCLIYATLYQMCTVWHLFVQIIVIHTCTHVCSTIYIYFLRWNNKITFSLQFNLMLPPLLQ